LLKFFTLEVSYTMTITKAFDNFSVPGHNMYGMRVSSVHRCNTLVSVRRGNVLHIYTYMERHILPVPSGGT